MKKKISLLFLVTMFTLLLATAVSAAPSKVTGLKQTDASSSSIDVEWDTILGNNIYYEVSMRTENDDWKTIATSRASSNFYENGLDAGKTYYVRVRAKEGISSSSYGAYSDTLKVVTAPETIENVVQTGATTSSFTITWTKVAGATSYLVYKKQDGQEYPLGTTTGTSYTVKNLNNKIEVPFDIYVCPINSSGTFNALADYAKGISDNNLELVPTKVQNVKIAYHWSNLNEAKIEFDGTEYGKGYEYQLYNYKGKKVKTGTVSSEYIYLKGLKRNTFYKIRVRSYVVVNTKNVYGAWSDYKMFGLQPKVKAKGLNKSVKLSWNKVQGAKSYTVYMSTRSGSGYKKVKTLKKTSIKITKFKKKKLKKWQTYYFKVVATTKFGKKTVKTGKDTYISGYFY